MSCPNYPNRKYNINETFFDEIDSEEKAYFLGLLYADGYNHPASSHTSIALKESDRSILEKLRDLIYNEPWPLKYKIRRKGAEGDLTNRQNQYQLCFSSKYLANKLVEFGCYPDKSLTLQFPNFLSKNLMPHFIRGYFDGDGSISLYKENNRGSIIMKSSWSIVSSHSFCLTCKSYLEELLPITPFLYQVSDKISCIKTNSKSNIKILSDYLYGTMETDLYLERKYILHQQLLDMMRDKTRYWEFIGKTRYAYNISEKQEKDLIDLYKKGKGIRYLSILFGVSTANILQHLNRLGVKTRPKTKYNLTKGEEISVINDYQSGISMPILEKKYHTSHRQIRKLLLENNIVVRTKGRSRSIP
jgi:hypothetical protein